MALTKVTYSMIHGAPVNVLDFGADPTGNADSSAAFTSAIAAATNDEVIAVPSGTYKLTTSLSIGALNTAARLIGIGKPILKFYGLNSTTDCVVINGAAMRQIEFSNFIVDCNNTGRDGVVLQASDTPIIDNVVIENSIRDTFVISCDGSSYVENGVFSMQTQNSGRHGVRLTLAGSGGAFINEILWKQLEVRGVSKVTAGANAISVDSTATSGGSKFSNLFFLKTNFDAQYNSAGSPPVPSTSPIEISSGIAENWTFTSGGWENTGGTTLASGYCVKVSGTGAVNGLTMISVITNSYWGSIGIDPAATTVWDLNFSFNYSRLAGLMKTPTNSQWYIYQTSGASNVTGDGTMFRLCETGESVLYNKHSDQVTDGIFVAPTTGQYHFEAQTLLTGVSAAHTISQLQIIIGSGSYAGFYPIAAINPYANNDGGNCWISGSIDLMIEEGVLVYVVVYVSGGTKTVGVQGGFQNTTRFSGSLIG